VRLQQVFWNIVKNAVKFTSNGGVITLRAWNEEGCFRLCVKDTGIGITPEEMPRLFEAFAQGDNAARFGGLGLGLSISAVLVSEQSGRIWAESAGRNQGAAFFVELPLAAPPVATASANGSSVYHHRHACRVLLVEDHATSRETLTRLLAARGHHVQTADSVSTAIARARETAFDFVISDIGLPDGTGYDLMEILQRDFGLRGIALTGYGMEADIDRSLRAGFREHLTKPIDFLALEGAITRLASDVTPRATPQMS
jgi:CheY-like chemotaxis protein